MNEKYAGLTVTRDDFIRLCGVRDEANRKPNGGCFDWFDDMRVCRNGVFLTDPGDADLTDDERDALPKPPNDDYDEPILRLPCTLAELRAFLDAQDFPDQVDAFALLDWAGSRVVHARDPSAHDTKLLRAAQWVIAEYWEGKDPKKGPTKADMIDKLKMLGALSDGALSDLSKGEAEAVDLVTRPDALRRSAP